MHHFKQTFSVTELLKLLDSLREEEHEVVYVGKNPVSYNYEVVYFDKHAGLTDY